MLLRAVPTLRRVFGVHALTTETMATLILGVAVATALLVALALYVAYYAWVRPVRLSRETGIGLGGIQRTGAENCGAGGERCKEAAA